MAMVVRDLKDLPEVHAPIPGMKPPVTSFPYQDQGNPDEVDEFLAFIRICARSPWWFRTRRDERSAPRHGRRLHLFKPEHALNQKCAAAALGHRLPISFMTRAELPFWPRGNKWGRNRADLLTGDIAAFTTLLPDDETCVRRADVVAESTASGHPIGSADAGIVGVLPAVGTSGHR